MKIWHAFGLFFFFEALAFLKLLSQICPFYFFDQATQTLKAAFHSALLFVGKPYILLPCRRCYVINIWSSIAVSNSFNISNNKH